MGECSDLDSVTVMRAVFCRVVEKDPGNDAHVAGLHQRRPLAKLQQHAAMVAGMSGPRALLHASFIAYGLLLVYRDAPSSSAKPAAVREETATQPTKQQQARVLNTAAAHVVVQICNA